MSHSDQNSSVENVVREVSRIVTEMAGVQLGPKQYSMVENRLKTRIMRLGLPGFDAYLDHLRQHKEEESQALLSLLTTHHTYFFREFSHFELLINQGLPVLIERARSRGDRKIRIWSAAASRGQEAYSLAMFFDFHLREAAPDLDFEIWGTDVDPESIAMGRNGVYKVEELKQVPAMYSREHWIRGSGDVANFAKIRDGLKSKVRFEAMNLLQPGGQIGDRMFDVIFCRNVYIYFDKDQIRTSTNFLLKHLDPVGFLFVGVSESLAGIDLAVRSVAPSVYRHPETQKAKKAPAAAAIPAPAPQPQQPIRVFCVDDSPAILTLLKKILTTENGFQVVGTAENGLVAQNWLKTGQADLMTMDIHMPEMDGVTFLEKTPASSRPPVLVLSSVNRDDPALGRKVLALGAFDYVEKPSLENLAQAGNEIRAKLRTAVRRPAASVVTSASPPPRSPPPSTSSLSSKAPSPMAPRATAGKSASTPEHASTTSNGKKKVLIVDDSPTIRQLLRQVLSSDPHLQVVAEADRPSLVEDLIKQHRPDVMTLDIHMPEMDGVALLKILQPKYGIPTIMISSISREEGPQVLQALEIGAVDYIQKPSLKDLSTVAPEIRERVKVAASTKARTQKRVVRKVSAAAGWEGDSIILLGASTGGTEALKHVFESMPSQIPPVLVVQHIPPVFSAAFAQRLNSLCPFEVKEAVDGDEVRANRVLIAPGGTQMGLVARGSKLFVRVNDDAPVNRHKPSVDYMFNSAAEIDLPGVVAGILTGMGADGARGLKRLRDGGARTIAQDAATSVVYGMPREAAMNGGAEFVKPLDEIADLIVKLCSERRTVKRPA